MRLPTLNGTLQYQRNINAPVFFFPAFSVTPDGGFSLDNNRMTPVAAALDNQYNAGLNLAMPLLQPNLPVIRQQAVVGQKMASEHVRATTIRQIADVKKQYLAVLLAQEQRSLLVQSIARAEQALREVRHLYRVQLATDADTL